jgi:hypothetical protein
MFRKSQTLVKNRENAPERDRTIITTVVDHPVAFVTALCLVLQILSATFFPRDLQTPNSSTQIAHALASEGRFAVDAWHRLRGPNAPIPDQPLRAFQLPGEPLYLAAGFTAVPRVAWRYLHVPVTVALVTAIAAVAFLLGGGTLALAAGLIATLDPFIVAHGPVWDDTFLGAAAEWIILAVLMWLLSTSETAMPAAATRRVALPLVMVVAAGLGAAARLQTQVVLAVLGCAAICWQQLRPLRNFGWAVVMGVMLSLGAWGVRNTIVLGHFFLGTTHDGLTLYESNYADARASTWQTGTEEGLSETHLTDEFARVASLGEVDADRRYNQDAWAYIAGHPQDVAKTAALKLGVSLTGVNLAAPLLSTRNILAIVTNVVFLLLAPLGFTALWQRSRGRSVEKLAAFACTLTCAATLGMLVLGPVGLRYRISAAGFLYIGVGAAIVHVVRLATRSETQTALAGRLAW